MIVQEFFRVREDGVRLIRTYSDAGMRIKQEDTGIIYDDAVDLEDTTHTYTETDEPLPPPYPPDEETGDGAEEEQG